MPQRLKSDIATKKSLEQEQRPIGLALAQKTEGIFMAETAFEQNLVFDQQTTIEAVFPTEVVSDLETDKFTREKAARFIGSCLLNELADVESASTVRPIESLYDAIHQAVEGNESAIKMVETNVRTDVVERTIKTGHVTKVDLMVDESGKIQQFGQSMESVQANSLRYASRAPQILARTKAETLNSFRIEQKYNEGKLDDYYFVVFSRAADDMSKQEMRDVGFFVETMSCAIQVTTKENGRLTTESAFVSGVAKSSDGRHDTQTVAGVGKKLGADYEGKSATEIIATPILVHKDIMPNGVIDLVKMYDETAGGTFFGEERQTEDYNNYVKKCQDREDDLSSIVSKITEALLAESKTIHSPVQAAQRLHKLSERHMVGRATYDTSIDARVFGSRAEEHILNARFQYAAGNYEQAELFTSLAVDTAVSSSCPTSGVGENNKAISGSKDSDQYGSLSFRCSKGHLNTRPRGKLIDNCKVCRISVKC